MTTPGRQDLLTSGLGVLPLPALLTAALVAFTLECDNQVELDLADRGHGGLLSLVVWLNAIQYLRDRPASVADICRQSHTSLDQVRFVMGKLEHWGWVVSVAQSDGQRRAPESTSRGRRRQAISAVTAKSTFGLTAKGEVVVDLWPGVIEEVEKRWRRRHGPALTAALKAASRLAAAPGVQMPEGVPCSSAHLAGGERFPEGDLDDPHGARVPVLLGRALLAVDFAYASRSPVPLALAANTLRVVDGKTPPSRLHTISGTSPETVASQTKALIHLGLAELVNAPSSRAKVLRLTSAGRSAQEHHTDTLEDVAGAIDRDGSAANALRLLLGGVYRADLALRAALTPPPGVRRSGELVAGTIEGLGWGTNLDIPSVRTRSRELVTQTEAFVADPFQNLPHYPIWEQTRAFGP